LGEKVVAVGVVVVVVILAVVVMDVSF